MSFQRDKAFSDQFVPHIRRILADHLIQIGNLHADRHENTDLLILQSGGFRVGCRVRRYAQDSWQKYRGQVTFRTFRASGLKTELEKIIEGWGDFFFYGWGVEGSGRCVDWHLIDLRAFRAFLIRNRAPLPSLFTREVKNPDGSGFVGLNLTSLPSGIILAAANNNFTQEVAA